MSLIWRILIYRIVGISAKESTYMKIAIIGSGISGLGAAYMLHQQHDITLFEKNDYVGGHSRTVITKTSDGDIPVDTGFIVFNKKNYPLLTALFEHLEVPIKETDMSFGADIAQGWLEYGTYHKLGGIFAQKKNIFRPSYLKMLSDIMRFNKQAPEYLRNGTDLSLGELLNEMKMGTWFRDYYLLAMGAAIWSTPTTKMTDFPAQTFLRFFDNHGLLTVNDHPQWYTVIGGSKEYVKRITTPYQENIKLNCAVKSVSRNNEKVTITDIENNNHTFDQVVFACHSDQAIKMLSDPSDEEKNIIGAIKYQPNDMVLHSDTSFMPKAKKAWSSWVYQSEGKTDNSGNVSLSYWMNNLQPLSTNKPIIVTLNPAREPAPSLVYDRYSFEHPVFDRDAIIAQSKLDDLQGKNNTWFCGAWQRYGFHEDGLLSAVNMVRKMGIEPEWI